MSLYMVDYNKNVSQISMTVAPPPLFTSTLSNINCPWDKFWEILSHANAEVTEPPKENPYCSYRLLSHSKKSFR